MGETGLPRDEDGHHCGSCRNLYCYECWCDDPGCCVDEDEEQEEFEYPSYCCGKCPKTAHGWVDCTCKGNPNCSKGKFDFREWLCWHYNQAGHTWVFKYWGIASVAFWLHEKLCLDNE